MENLSKTITCIMCKTTGLVDLVRNINNTGASNVFWKCRACGKNAMGSAYWISHKKIVDHGISIDDIPVNEDQRSDLCAVCGEPGVHLHHWAPRFIFGDICDNWPVSYLCRKHHQEWHDRVTPRMCEK